LLHSTGARASDSSTGHSADGTPIACWRNGQGPPLVAVHPTTSDHHSWDSLLPTLTAHFTVYAMDRRDRGGSGDAPNAVEREFEDVAAVVDAVADQVGEPGYLLGHSYGAVCALGAAGLTPNLAKLVLYEPPAIWLSTRFPAGFVAELQALIARDKREETLDRFAQVVLERSPAEIERMRSQPNWEARVAAAHTVAREIALEDSYRFEPERFTAIRTPTLLLQGELTQPFLKTSTQAVHGALPNSRVVVLPGQAHFAMRTAPELFLTEVLRFLL
jgi:pimeloyl-ACP methyl ester carboxylesterase